MNATPKIIQIYLPGGDSRGIRGAEVNFFSVSVHKVGKAIQALPMKN